jgi:hypothetical protein
LKTGLSPSRLDHQERTFRENPQIHDPSQFLLSLGFRLLLFADQFVEPMTQWTSGNFSDYSFELPVIHPYPAARLTAIQNESLESVGL